jgi:hypothetical protein
MIMRMAASAAQVLQVRVLPRGARIVRAAVVMVPGC